MKCLSVLSQQCYSYKVKRLVPELFELSPCYAPLIACFVSFFRPKLNTTAMSFIRRCAICPLKIAYKRYKRPINTQRIITAVSGGSRPSDKGGGGWGAVIQTLRKGGGPVSKKFFSALRGSAWSKIRGRDGPHGSLPWIRH